MPYPRSFRNTQNVSGPHRILLNHLSGSRTSLLACIHLALSRHTTVPFFMTSLPRTLAHPLLTEFPSTASSSSRARSASVPNGSMISLRNRILPSGVTRAPTTCGTSFRNSGGTRIWNTGCLRVSTVEGDRLSRMRSRGRTARFPPPSRSD